MFQERFQMSKEQEFNEFWESYPRKIARIAALKAWNKKVSRLESPAVMQGLYIWRLYWWHTQKDTEFIPHASTWINQERWRETPANGNGRRETAVGRGPELTEAQRQQVQRSRQERMKQKSQQSQ